MIHLKIADLKAVSEIDPNFEKNSTLIYERKKTKSFNTSTGIKFRPFLASREEFFKGAILIENDSEFILKDNLFFNTNLKYSIADNFDDLIYPPVNVFPAQVRSVIKDYLKNNPKVSNLYDEMALNIDLDFEEYKGAIKSLLSGWSYDKWTIQDGSSERTLIYTKRDHE